MSIQNILYKFNSLTGSTCESIYMMLCTHKNPCLFQFYRSSARWVLVSNCNNLALKENRIMQAQLDSLICVTPAPLSLILIYQNEVFTAKEHIKNLILIKTGIWNWYCITLNSNNHISYKKYEISICSLTNQTHTQISTKKQQQKQCKRRNKKKVS